MSVDNCFKSLANEMSILASLDNFLFNNTLWEYMYFRDTGNFKVTGALQSQAAWIRKILLYIKIKMNAANFH